MINAVSLLAIPFLLTMFPLVSIAGVQIAAERERTRYVASLMALVALGTAWVAILMTARWANCEYEFHAHRLVGLNCTAETAAAGNAANKYQQRRDTK